RGFTVTANIPGVEANAIVAAPLRLLKIAYPLLDGTFSGPFAGGTTITVTFDRRAGTFQALVTGGGATFLDVRGRFTPVLVSGLQGAPPTNLIALAESVTVNNPGFEGVFDQGVLKRIPFDLTGDDLETLLLRVNGQNITLIRQ
ncbi:MAG TPA: hypothetical protein VK689_23290, partial [Armatimonadota bacterium]|nr:hypothetical protein [Armatimonadota bacterium]